MQSQTSTSIGLTTPIFLIFLVLKLTNLIDWSWIWVLSPLWIPLVCVLTFLLLAVMVSYIASNFIK